MWNYGTYGKAMPLKYQIISQLGSNSIGSVLSTGILTVCFQHVIFLSHTLSQCIQFFVSIARYAVFILLYFWFLLFVWFRLTHFVPAYIGLSASLHPFQAHTFEKRSRGSQPVSKCCVRVTGVWYVCVYLCAERFKIKFGLPCAEDRMKCRIYAAMFLSVVSSAAGKFISNAHFTSAKLLGTTSNNWFAMTINHQHFSNQRNHSNIKRFSTCA